MDENLIFVDADTRTAVLQTDFSLGVEHDDSCRTIVFQVNKPSDIDLSNMTFYVNTISSRGNGDLLECTKEEQDNYINITCLLKGTVFESKGIATINLCAREYDSNNNIVKKWGTEDISVVVGAHTDADKAIEEKYPSVLEDLKKKIDNLNITDAQLNSIAEQVAKKGFCTKTEVDDLIKKITIPTLLSELTDDTTHRLVTDAEKEKWNSKSDFDGSYNSLEDKPKFKTVNGNSIIGDGDITVSGGGSSITVDTSLNTNSDNAISNKAVTTALNKKANLTDLGINIITKTSSDTVVTLENNTYYVFPTMSTLTITPPSADSGKLSICGFEFTSGSTATSLTLKNCTLTNSDDVVANKTYEVNILNGSAIVRAR